MELNILIRQVPELLISVWWRGNDNRHLFSVVVGCHRNKNSYYIGRYQDMVHGQCLRTVDGPAPTAVSYTSPNVCCLHCPIQWPFPTSPSFSSVSFPCCPHPLPFLPFLRTFSNLSLSHQHVNMWPSPLRCKASQPANTLYSSWPLLSARNMTSAAAIPSRCRGTCVL